MNDLAGKHAAIKDVRGIGLMLAAELDSEQLAKTVAAKMLERHIVINRTSETVLRFLPPYILGKGHVDATILALDEILTEQEAEASIASRTADVLQKRT